MTASLYTNCGNFTISLICSERGWQVNYAEEIKHLVQNPLFTLNRITAPRAAVIKGHRVELYEKNGFLGDQFKSAAYPLCNEDLASYTA